MPVRRVNARSTGLDTLNESCVTSVIVTLVTPAGCASVGAAEPTSTTVSARRMSRRMSVVSLGCVRLDDEQGPVADRYGRDGHAELVADTARRARHQRFVVERI